MGGVLPASARLLTVRTATSFTFPQGHRHITCCAPSSSYTLAPVGSLARLSSRSHPIPMYQKSYKATKRVSLVSRANPSLLPCLLQAPSIDRLHTPQDHTATACAGRLCSSHRSLARAPLLPSPRLSARRTDACDGAVHGQGAARQRWRGHDQRVRHPLDMRRVGSPARLRVEHATNELEHRRGASAHRRRQIDAQAVSSGDGLRRRECTPLGHHGQGRRGSR